jgi:hypothetical protein
MFIADTDADARRLLQRLLLELGLSADLDELDRRVEADPAFLQELKARGHFATWQASRPSHHRAT